MGSLHSGEHRMNWDHEPPALILCAHGAKWFLLSLRALRERTEVRGKGFLACPTAFEPLPVYGKNCCPKRSRYCQLSDSLATGGHSHDLESSYPT